MSDITNGGLNFFMESQTHKKMDKDGINLTFCTYTQI